MDLADVRRTVADTLDINEYPPEGQEAIVSAIAELAGKRIIIDLTAALPQGERSAFLDMVEAGDDKSIQAYLTAHIPGFADIVHEAVKTEIDAFREAKEHGFG